MDMNVGIQMSMCVYVMMCLTHTNQPTTVQSQAAVQRGAITLLLMLPEELL